MDKEWRVTVATMADYYNESKLSIRAIADGMGLSYGRVAQDIYLGLCLKEERWAHLCQPLATKSEAIELIKSTKKKERKSVLTQILEAKDGR